jgi:hypothetical protein
MLALADEVAERLARLEEQMRYVVTALEHLSGRDSELEARLRELSDRFNQALTAHADSFRASLGEITDRFVSRDDWAFWKNLLTAALLGLLAYGWSTLSGIHH